MSKHRGPRITRAQAERLLATGTGGPEALSALLAAAASPAADGEVAGEHAALMEFRAASLSTVSPPRRPSLFKTVLANAVAAKFVAVAAAAAATGGVALAAATGHLPGPLHDGAHSAPGAPAADSTAPTEPAETGEPTDVTDSSEPSSPADEPGESDSPHGSATPSPSLTGLCRAFQAGATDNPGKALDNPAFTVLVTAAGGKDEVAAYCVTLIGPARSHPAGPPSTHPTGAPSHPTGAPSHPTGAPSHPTGAPSHPTASPDHRTGRP